MDFRPLFIAPALLRLDTVLNVDKQADAAPLLLGGFGGAGALSGYPFPDGFLCVVRAEGFKTGETLLPRCAARHIFPRLYLIARRL